MNCLILIAVSYILVLGVDGLKDGYPDKGGNCKYECLRDEYCDDLCKKKKAKSGYCYWGKLSCYCYGLPDNEPTRGSSGKCRPALGRK
ncbi:alpha-toxin CsE5-like [Centruroides sculpturatus]|uniref:alpha-toxin CsE5-like n=1 Tax=Centruroides sculpturatus TaxID=218467 RepID=UPI000C6E92A7|nr:alpha-toxin CsE5-like [Centruroides sculpturatus]